MRLGQGFNSYTQQICVDDAVVIDEKRPENVVTNDGTTMRIMAQKAATPSAWTRQKEVISGQTATAVLEENAKKAKEDVKLIEEALNDDDVKESTANSKSEGESDGKGEGGQAEHHQSGEESGSVDEVPDTQEAHEAAHAPAAKDTKAPEASGKKDAGSKEATGKPTQQHKGDDDKSDRKAAAKEIKANDSTDDNPDRAAREEMVANIEGNSLKPSADKKKPGKRGSSSDRERSRPAKSTTSPLDRAAIKAALTGKPAPNAAAAAKDEAEQARLQKEEAEVLAEERRYKRELEKEQRKEEVDRRAEDRQEQRAIRSEKRAWDAKRREDARKAIENAANLKATSLEDLAKIRAQNQFIERFNGMSSEQTQKYDFDPTAPRGPSQTVTYTSRFVDRLSDVMDDMSVSGSLSIKAGKVGGSGKGSFVDSDKFKESDLNFYISVKVVNQTINFKDALVYNPLRSVDEKKEEDFRKVYGDSFISGFIEGGEFNAIVSMKILNKAKKTDIQAEAKIALTAGAVQIEAEANVGIARSNIETNTETTIQVSWSGGGHIKPMEQQWDIQSLMAAAARFPDLVADCPQRTYAILTKYDALRSFVARKPASYTPLQYENAQIYTNTLLDSFVSYKALYKRLGEQIFGVQGKTLEVIPWSDTDKAKVAVNSNGVSPMQKKDESSGLYPYTEQSSYFEASLKGLSDARTAIRRQMARIVNEVDAIEKDPKLATDEDHSEPFQSPVAFETRIPVVEVPERLRVRSNPLSGKRIAAKPLTEEEQKKQIAEEEELAKAAPLYVSTDKLEDEEKKTFDSILGDNPILGAHYRASSAAGDSMKGEGFNNLDFLKPEWDVRSIRTEMFNGALVYLAVSYTNGLLVERGASREKTRIKKFGPFLPGERINSASIEYGREKAAAAKTPNEKVPVMMPIQVLGLRLYTNRGRALIARAISSAGDKGIVVKDTVTYENVSVLYIDVPFSSGTLKGFFGRSDDSSADGKIYRLGIIWARVKDTPPQESEAQYVNASDTVDSEDLASLQKDQKAGSQALQEMTQKLATAQAALDQKSKQVSELEKLRDSRPIEEAQCGSFSARDKGWAAGTEAAVARCSVTFARRYAAPPKLLFGLSTVDASSTIVRGPPGMSIQVDVKCRALSLNTPQVQADQFSVNAASLTGCVGHNLSCHWMTLPNDLHLENAIVDTYGTGQPDFQVFSRFVFFNQAFTTPPKIAVWFQEFEWLGGDFMSIKCYAADITCNSFTMKVESWAGRKFKNARVQFLAYPSEEDGKRVKNGRNSVTRAQPKWSKRDNFYGQPFKDTPKTFIAISEMDFALNRNLRLTASASAPNNRELQWDFWTWDNSDMDHAEVQWIALE